MGFGGEIGVAIGAEDHGLQTIGFMGACGGAMAGTELEGASFDVIIGVWTELNKIPGESWTVGEEKIL